MSLIDLKAELRQELRLTPQLLQSMEILQMSSQDLLDYVNRMAEENPLIEQEDISQAQTAYEELCQKVSWLDNRPVGGFLPSADSLAEYGATDHALDSLTAFLCDQLERKKLPKPLLTLTKYMAELLDENGWLAQEDLDELAELNIPEELICQALETLQSLEPAGIGARNLSECLLLQLDRQENTSPLLRELVTRFLPELGKKHYGPIRQELNVSTAEIVEAEAVIAALDPRPSQAFQPSAPVEYIRPDIFIVELDGTLRAILNEYYLPRISMNDYYIRMLKTTDEKDAVEYLRQKMQQAKGLISGLERRNTTIQRCAEEILAVQHEFFAGNAATPVPMTLSSLAEALSLHPSTISRATRGKYLQCRHGTYPLRYFFGRSLGQAEYSTQMIRQRIWELIQNEDPTHPLSDQKICKQLETEGIQIARRTVAKYRVELRLDASNIRKRRS